MYPGLRMCGRSRLLGLPILTVTPDRERLALFGLDVSSVQETLRIALGGETAGQVFEGDRRFRHRGPLAGTATQRYRTDWADYRYTSALRSREVEVSGDADMLGMSPVRHRISFPWSEVARIEMTLGPNQISRENGKRRDCGHGQCPRARLGWLRD